MHTHTNATIAASIYIYIYIYAQADKTRCALHTVQTYIDGGMLMDIV